MAIFSSLALSAILTAPLLATGNEEPFPSRSPSWSPMNLPCERTTGINSIIGGTEIEKGSRPYLLSIGVFSNNEPFHKCAASLISPRAVMTAAHCLFNSLGRWDPPLWVDFNRHNLKDDTGVTRRFLNDTTQVTGDAIFHPEYNLQPFDKDVAILFLTEAMNDITPITINFDRDVPAEQCDDLDVAGWGDTRTGGDNSDFPLAVTLDYYPNRACTMEPFQWDSNLISGNMMCAVAGGKATCHGDSGGPLVLGQAEGGPSQPFLQVGIVSFGASAAAGGCENSRLPPVFTRVSSVACWVARRVCARTGELCDNPCSAPSSSPSTSLIPSQSSKPSLSPSVSGMPSILSHPSQRPSLSSKPRGSKKGKKKGKSSK